MATFATIDPAALERDLLQKWREAAQADASADAAEGNQTRVRAVLSNLVLLHSATQAIPRKLIDDFITDICIAFPSRIFVVELSYTEGNPIEVSVSSRCVLARSGVHVCSEEIHFLVRPAGVPVAANLLNSLFVADVSRVLALPGDVISPPPSSERAEPSRPDANFLRLFRAIRNVTDRVLFDSCQFVRQDRSVRAIRTTEDAVQGEVQIEYNSLLDLNWARSERWRQLVAEMFDTPLLGSAIDSLERVVFRYWPGPRGPEALPGDVVLLAGWVSQALELVPVQFSAKEANLQLVHERAGSGAFTPRSVFFSFQPHDAASAATAGAGLAEIAFEFDDTKSAGVVGAGTAFVRRLMAEKRSSGVTNRAEVGVESRVSGKLSDALRASVSRRVPFRQLTVEDLFLDTIVSDGGEAVFLRSLGASEMIASLWGKR